MRDLDNIRSGIAKGEFELRIEGAKNGKVLRWVEFHAKASTIGSTWDVNILFGDGTNYYASFPAASFEQDFMDLYLEMRNGLVGDSVS